MLVNLRPISIFPRPQPILFAILLGLVIVLSACGSIEQDLTVHENEEWKAETRFGLKPEELSLVGESDITDRLNRQQNAARAQGVNFEWNRKKGDDNRIYFIVNASGSGYDLLNQIVFDGDATIESVTIDGREAIQLEYTSSYELARYRLSLSTGEVLESNGIQSSKGKVSWEGSGRTMQAVFLPRSSLNLPLLAGGTIIVFILGGILIVSLQARRRQAESQNISFPSEFCHRCGGQLPAAGSFCPHCGASRLRQTNQLISAQPNR